MSSTLSLLFRHPPIRVSALAIFFFGFTGAATSPYMSLIGIRELGLSDAVYSAIIFTAALVNVSASVTAGIVADRLGRFRSSMIAAALFGVVGFGMVYVFPTAPVFVVATLIFLPIFGALNSLIFAHVRTSSSGMSARELMAVNSAIRAVLSASWVLVPGLVGIVLAGAPSMLPAFLLASLACCICVALFTFGVKEQTPVAGLTKSVDHSFLRSLGQIAAPPVLVRLLAIALISSMLHVNGTVLPLIVTGAAGGSAADVGIIVGIVAFLEILFILFWGWVEARASPIFAVGVGASIYCSYLVFLGFADSRVDVYVLTLVSGLGAAAIIAVPISYLQNLIADRAGLGSSLIAVNIFVSGGLSSLLFATGTSLSDYSGTALIGALAGLCGVALLWFLDGSASRMRRKPEVAQGGDPLVAGEGETA
ncbi:MFS transporter [Rhizobium sp. AAP43]|uniref:MFS transporter n=1 Tax=Rhizobium sp. AAP43 TaxID=1523420 RepID=UPI0009E8510B|nr:MFS transporter [Rhizobium sp. AAP43]